jgi:putative SOS response-associated peptidase YedK
MCGRYTLKTPGEAIAKLFSLGEVPDLEPRYNIAPSQWIACVRRPRRSQREFCVLRWGLVPFWAKDKSIGSRLINARSETASGKPAFRAAMRYRRCLLPADGFYEWQESQQGKQPVYLQVGEGDLFALAGLWESWESSQGEVLDTALVLTTRPNERVGRFHDRMPVIVEPEDYDRWLDPQLQDPGELADVFEPLDSDRMKAYSVSKKVNRPSHDAPDCIEPLAGQ